MWAASQHPRNGGQACGAAPSPPALAPPRRPAGAPKLGRAGSGHVHTNCPEPAESRPRQALPPSGGGNPQPSPLPSAEDAAANRALTRSAGFKLLLYPPPWSSSRGTASPIRRARSRRGSSPPGRRLRAAAGQAPLRAGEGAPGRAGRTQERRGEGHPPAGEEAGGSRAPSPGSPSCGGSPPPRCAAPGRASPWRPGDGRSWRDAAVPGLSPRLSSPPSARRGRSPGGLRFRSARPGEGGTLPAAPPSSRTSLPAPAPGGVSLRPVSGGGAFGRGGRREVLAIRSCSAGSSAGKLASAKGPPGKAASFYSAAKPNTWQPGGGAARAGAARRGWASASAFPPLAPRLCQRRWGCRQGR